MSYARRRTDANHAQIRDGLRELGWTVFDTHDLGAGFPDLVVIRKDGRAAMLFEVKPKADARLANTEVEFILKLAEPAYRLVTTVEQAVAALGPE